MRSGYGARTSLRNKVTSMMMRTVNEAPIKHGKKYGNRRQNGVSNVPGNWSAGLERVPPISGLRIDVQCVERTALATIFLPDRSS